MTNPIEAIKSTYPRLSKTQKRIADYILEAGDKICFISLADLSTAAGVTPVTTARFCRSIGFTGFSDFRKAFQDYVQEVVSPKSHQKQSDHYREAENDLNQCPDGA